MVYESLMQGLALCEEGESLIEAGQLEQARIVLQEAWDVVAPVIDSADFCGYGKRCDRYCARIRTALARCDVQAASGAKANPRLSDEAINELRVCLPDDALNPDAHIVFANALLSAMSAETRQSPDGWLDPLYMEAHYHASIACALKRANRSAGHHQGMGRGNDAPGVVPESVKALFAGLGDKDGWRRVIFCTGANRFCSWLEADAAAVALVHPQIPGVSEFKKKKATFVLLGGSYTLSLSMFGALIDIYGIDDRHRLPQIAVPESPAGFLQAASGSRMRLRNLVVASPGPHAFEVGDKSTMAMTNVSFKGDAQYVMEVSGLGTRLMLVGCRVSLKGNTAIVVRDGAICDMTRGWGRARLSPTHDLKPWAVDQRGQRHAPAQQLLLSDQKIPREFLADAVWREQFFTSVAHLAHAVAWFDGCALQQHFNRDLVKLCATDEEATAALCPAEPLAYPVVVLTAPRLTVKSPVNVVDAVLYGFPSNGAPCQLTIELPKKESSARLSDASALIEFGPPGSPTASLLACNVEVSVVADQTDPWVAALAASFGQAI